MMQPNPGDGMEDSRKWWIWEWYLMGQFGENENSLMLGARKENPKHRSIFKMPTSDFLKTESYVSLVWTTCFLLWEVVGTFSIVWGAEQLYGRCLGTGTRSPSSLSVNCMQAQLCFLCLLTSSPVIKALPGELCWRSGLGCVRQRSPGGWFQSLQGSDSCWLGEEAGWSWHALCLTVVYGCSPGQ